MKKIVKLRFGANVKRVWMVIPLVIGATLSGCVVNPDGSSSFVPVDQKSRLAYMKEWETYSHENSR